MSIGKKVLIWVGSIVLIVLLLNITLSYTVKNKVKEQLTEEFDLAYSEVSCSIWDREIIIDSIENNDNKGRINKLCVSRINWLSLFKTRNLDLDNVSLTITDLYYPLKANNQYIKIDSISKIGNDLTLFDFDYSPSHDVDQYMSMLKTRKPYISLQIPILNLNQVDIRKKHVGAVAASGYKCLISEDLNIPNGSHKKKLLVEVLRGHEVAFLIDAIDLKNGDVTYSLKDKGSNSRGFIEFNEMHISGENITNDSLAIVENQEMIIELSAKIENSAPLKVITKHFLGESNSHYDLYAKLTDLNLSHANNILKSSKGITVKNGEIISLEMNGEFNDHSSSGEVTIDYKDLKIDLNKNYAGIVNLFGNLAINNDKKDSAPFVLGRNSEKSFTIHIWQSLLVALRKIILVI